MMSIVTLTLAYSTMQLLLGFTQTQVITTILSPRENYTGALDPSSVVQFNCTMIGTNVIQWRVDDIPASDNDI